MLYSMTKGNRQYAKSTSSSIPAESVKLSRKQTRMLKYLRDCANRLGLTNWEVVLLPGTPEDDAEADVHRREAQRAEFRFSQEFWTFNPEYQRLVVAHELSHMIVARMSDHVESLQSVVSSDSYKVIAATFESCEEHDVQHVARLLAPLLSLPEF